MDRRGISPVIGVGLLVVIAVLLVTVAAVMVTGASENALGTAAVHSQANYDVHIENEEDEQLVISLRNFQSVGSETDFILRINDREIQRWGGQAEDRIEVECLYPGDEVELVSANGDTTVLVEEFEVENPTECTRYNSFENKFPNAVVDGTSYQVRDEYDLGLSIVPDGNDGIGNISLQNDWHYVELYDEQSVEGLEPPVFVLIVTDNVHVSGVPTDDLDEVDEGEEFGWDDDPPDGLNPGASSFEIDDGELTRTAGGTSTEPTNDLYFVFQPGCDSSTLRLVEWYGTNANEIYLGDELIIDDTTSVSTPQSFDAPGVDCPDGFSW